MNLDRPQAPDPYSLLPQLPSVQVTAAGFTDGGELPQAQAFGGGNTSPALSWSGAPQDTVAYALTCFDPDAPTPSGFWHWCVIGIPGDVTSVPEGAGSAVGDQLPPGATHLKNDFGTADFGGAAPPEGDRPHRYMFAVHALDTADLGVDAAASPARASFVMLGHTLARGVVTGMYAV